MMSDHAERRPYRVVFTPGGQTTPERRGVIVARDEQTAHREARNIANAGGHAEVQHVGEGGHRQILAAYPARGQAPRGSHSS